MPTHVEEDRFLADYIRLTAVERAAFKAAIRKFAHDLHAGQLRKGLRIKRVQGHPGVWEMAWAPDGRATFHYGDSIRPGDPHVIWRRVGSHDIFDDP